jgi:dihydroorotate dehydrogenase (NAD+) catalytic subunit
MDTSITILGSKFKNPLILASGIVDTTASSLVYAIENGAGAVTCKSISLEPRKGHNPPVIITNDIGMLNAVGLSNPGIDSSINEIREFKQRCQAPLIGNIFATSVADFKTATTKISKSGCDFLELNLSCPNVEDEFGKPFACDIDLAANLTKECKKASKIPISIKLAPNVPNIVDIAIAVEKAGADCITAINTTPGMKIDIFSAKPVLTNKSGGYSGPPLKPIAVKCIFDIYQKVKIPIIGTGGITSGEDAIEFLMAGSSGLGIGSAVYYEGISVFNKINLEIRDFMREHNYENISDIIGVAHE